MAKIISYTKHPQSVCGEDGSKFSGVLNIVYDNVEFTLATGNTNYNVKANVAGAFSNVASARYLNIRTDVTITIKLNLVTNSSITITSSDSPFKVDSLEITNILVSNDSGSNANIKIFLT